MLQEVSMLVQQNKRKNRNKMLIRAVKTDGALGSFIV